MAKIDELIETRSITLRSAPPSSPPLPASSSGSSAIRTSPMPNGHGEQKQAPEKAVTKWDVEFEALKEQLLERTDRALQAKEAERLREFQAMEDQLLARDR